MVRVLKPSGSCFVNLGDKYAGSGGAGGDYNPGGLKDGQPKYGAVRTERNDQKRGELPNPPASWGTREARMPKYASAIPAKSLMLLPHRYAIRCIDELGLICRQDQVWSKPNGLPESVTDRTRRSHEYWFHLVKSPKYFSAIDEIRELQTDPNRRGPDSGSPRRLEAGVNQGFGLAGKFEREYNPLGKLPGSVWQIPTQPLKVPAHLGVDHFAAFPEEWPRRLILGWSPSGICVECHEGRRPVVDKKANGRVQTGNNGIGTTHSRETLGLKAVNRQEWANEVTATITGYACACPEPTGDTRPSVVLDPFGGTGTTSLVAKTLGRIGISVDLSHDYSRLAQWRTSKHSVKAMSRTNHERQGQML